ncbi:Transcription factor [Niveomyces insectorum RCEF 264]|uniref:Transcription factor n=1 Tax=Niveomyces insectorum RCEF 264 TaxID=1081102 RepID=A0A167N9M4_9HYPO|nr:Transcription factor [Niveomyces insectorum RCEF 264]
MVNGEGIFRFTVGWRRQRRAQRNGPGVVPLAHQGNDAGRRQQSRRLGDDDVSTTLSGSPSAAAPTGAPTYAYSASSAAAAAAAARDDDGAASDPPESEVALSINLAENGLLRFFRDGLSSTSWGVFDDPDRIRVLYVGTHTSNMTHLIKLNRPQPQYIVYQYPQIRPPSSWEAGMEHLPDSPSFSPSASSSSSSAAHHGSSRSGRGGSSGSSTTTTTAAAAASIKQDINSFPEKEIRDDFIDAYFEKVNPYFPVIDEYDFRKRYAESQPPLVLLHAILLVGAHVSSHAKARQARHIVKAVLFRRAKTVFDMRHEHDRLHLVQAAMLFTWHLQNGDTASANSFYWLGVACRIAFGIGLHRDLLRDPPNLDRMPMHDRRHWKRIWWTLFQLEVLSALEHGRPPAIRREDFDHDPMTPEDFREGSGALNPKVHSAFCTKNAELCQIALEVINLAAPSASLLNLDLRMGALNAQLITWMLNLPSSSAASTAASGDLFGDVLLRLHYHTVVIHLYRLVADHQGLPTTLLDAANGGGGGGGGGGGIGHGGGSGEEEARRIGSSASADIVAGFEALHGRSLLAQCPFTAVTALTAAGVQIAKDVQDALGSAQTMLAVNGLCLLDRACAVAEHLSVFWPNAGGVRNVLRSLFDQFTGALNGIQQGERSVESLVNDDFGGVDWTEILGLTWPANQAYDPDQIWDTSILGLD